MALSKQMKGIVSIGNSIKYNAGIDSIMPEFPSNQDHQPRDWSKRSRNTNQPRSQGDTSQNAKNRQGRQWPQGNRPTSGQNTQRPQGNQQWGNHQQRQRPGSNNQQWGNHQQGQRPRNSSQHAGNRNQSQWGQPHAQGTWGQRQSSIRNRNQRQFMNNQVWPGQQYHGDRVRYPPEGYDRRRYFGQWHTPMPVAAPSFTPMPMYDPGEIAGVPYDMLDDYVGDYAESYQEPYYPGMNMPRPGFAQGMGVAGFGQGNFGQGMGGFGQGMGFQGGFGQQQDPDEIDNGSSEGKTLRDCAVVNNNGQAYEQCRGGFVRQQTDGWLSTGTRLSGCGFMSQNGEQFERCNQVFVRQVNGASQTF